MATQPVLGLSMVNSRGAWCQYELAGCLCTEKERELRKEGRELPSRVRLREGPIGVRITLGQPTILSL